MTASARLRLFAAMAAASVAACGDPVDPAMQRGGWVAVAAGAYHTCALAADGGAYCWGRNDAGQLGTTDRAGSAYPRRVVTDEPFTAIAAGAAHTCAVTGVGGVWCWGANDAGQLGTGTIDEGHAAPAAVAASGYRQVAAGSRHSCAVDASGGVWCWGASGQGQAGRAGGDSGVPLRLAAAGFAQVSAGGAHSCALDVQGAAWCWGGNAFGQLGDATTVDRPVPAPVHGEAGLRDIAAGFTHTCAATGGGAVLCWGSADHGELGTGGVAVPGLPGSTVPLQTLEINGIGRVATAFHNVCAVNVGNIAFCWGRGGDAQLGSGWSGDQWTPRALSFGVAFSDRFPVTHVALGVTHGCALVQGGVLYCWGSGPDGQLGAGALLHSPIAVRVSAAR